MCGHDVAHTTAPVTAAHTMAPDTEVPAHDDGVQTLTPEQNRQHTTDPKLHGLRNNMRQDVMHPPQEGPRAEALPIGNAGVH